MCVRRTAGQERKERDVYDFGENIFMNNEKYLDELDGRLQVLNELRKRIIELSKAIIGDTLYKEDFFFTSAMDRRIGESY